MSSFFVACYVLHLRGMCVPVVCFVLYALVLVLVSHSSSCRYYPSSDDDHVALAMRIYIFLVHDTLLLHSLAAGYDRLRPATDMLKLSP